MPADTLADEGAVSEAVVTDMAKGALKVLDVDFAFAITGLLGPIATTDRVEVGTIWMAVADKDEVKTKKFWFPYDRVRNKEMAVSMGMLMIWKFISRK